MNIDTLLGGRCGTQEFCSCSLEKKPSVVKEPASLDFRQRRNAHVWHISIAHCVCGHGRVCVHTLCSSSFGYPLAQSAAQNSTNSWGPFHNSRLRIKSEDFPLILNLSMTCFHERCSTKVPGHFCSKSKMKITDLILFEYVSLYPF